LSVQQFPQAGQINPLLVSILKAMWVSDTQIPANAAFDANNDD
jgi:hypothetical protein